MPLPKKRCSGRTVISLINTWVEGGFDPPATVWQVAVQVPKATSLHSPSPIGTPPGLQMAGLSVQTPPTQTVQERPFAQCLPRSHCSAPSGFPSPQTVTCTWETVTAAADAKGAKWFHNERERARSPHPIQTLFRSPVRMSRFLVNLYIIPNWLS